MDIENQYRVIDLFCGAGGFSTGFEKAGFNVILAIDNWRPAYLTHKMNHPSCNTILEDIERISWLEDADFNKVIPDSEIIIGSPPCVAFSNSNKSGKSDKTLGKRLFESFLRIVARKKYQDGSVLKYWILENVPNIEKYIKREYNAKELGLKGNFKLNVFNGNSGIYNAKYYGVASNRKRFFCGYFLQPDKVIKSDEECITLRKILEALEIRNVIKGKECILDPNFSLPISLNEVSDLNYVREIGKNEWEKAKRLKTDKGFMGRMSFPEDLNKPARTVMATLATSSREAMIFNYKKNRYRLPTVREIATVMSFPLNYRFYGKSITDKHKLVGNAVPVKLAYAFAKAIAIKENLKYNTRYEPNKFDKSIIFYDLNGEKFPITQEKSKKLNSRFKYHIPYFIIDSYRVELTNYHSDFDNLVFKWETEIHKSSGKYAKKFTPSLDFIEITIETEKKISIFVSEISKKLPSYLDLQEVYCLNGNKKDLFIGPFELLDLVKVFLYHNFTKKELEENISINDKPFNLPKGIAVGYYALEKLIIFMKGK